MTESNKKHGTERRQMHIQYEGKYFLIGVIVGSLLSIFWDMFIFNNFVVSVNEETKLEVLKQDTEERLIAYMDGEWGSSQKEVVVKVNVNTKNQLIVLEKEKDETITKHEYRISGVNEINGFLGIVVFTVCDVESKIECVKMQFNKVFGIPQIINITYDSRISDCFSSEDGCTRAFKRIN